MSPSPGARTRRAAGPVLAGVLLAAAIWLVLDALVAATTPPGLEIPVSRLVLDRHGQLLRAFPVAEGRVRLPVDLGEVDPGLIALLLAMEDRRFHGHPGVDPLALGRAGVQLVTRGRIVSGGSTITMQLVRLLTGLDTRGPGGKLRQILAALALERQADKAAILTAYLNVAPYGGNLEGLRAGSLAWLGKEPKRLSTAEAALLVALPQAPEARRPDRAPELARRARDLVLARAQELGLIDAETASAARREAVPDRRRPLPLLAPHSAERLARAHPDRRELRLTLDAGLQSSLEALAAERAAALDPRVSVALVAVDHGRGEILASVGSAGYFDADRDGFIDMTRAHRSPGSTLKPLIYGLAFESGIAHPASLIEDRPSAFAGYVPSNFDREYQGTVTVGRALALSLNVPAVQLLEALGPARLIARLRRAGVAPRLADSSPPGLAIGLGGVGVTLTDLVALYAALARGGESVALRERLGEGAVRDQRPRVLEAPAVWYLGAILREAPAPTNSAPAGLAFKTGTSYGYRDAWAIGWDGRHVVGVWVGRPDGSPVPGLIGIEAAAPILVDAFARLGPLVEPPRPPPGVLMAGTTQLPPPLRQARVRGVLPAVAPGAPGAPEIAFPPDGARLELAAGLGGGLTLKVRAGSPPFSWFADGAPIGREPFERAIRWTPSGPGFTEISVVDGRGLGSRVGIYLE